jgi:hypothetical protein
MLGMMQLDSATSWPANIRRIALVTCIASALALLLPLWNDTWSIIGLRSTSAGPGWRFIPGTVLAILFSAVMPVFYFALYRDQGKLHFTKHLRFISFGAAIIVGFFVHAGLRVEYLDDASWSLTRTSRALSELANITYLFLLIAFCLQQSAESDHEDSGSRLLNGVAQIAVIMWGFWLAFLLIRVLLIPYTHSLLKDTALRNGATAPTFTALLEEAVRTLLNQASLFAAPYIIFKSHSSALPRTSVSPQLAAEN